MLLIRKIIDVGKTSRGIILPKSWLEHAEECSGQSIKTVAIEVNGILKVSAIVPKQNLTNSSETQKKENP